MGDDIITAQQLKKAIDSYGGVRGCRAAVVEVDTQKNKQPVRTRLVVLVS